MTVFLTILHVLAAFVLVTVVLLQHGKGADIGAAFGGGASQTVFGSRGAGNFLTKMTTLFVVMFMGTSFSLSYLKTERSLLDDIEVPETPATAPESTPFPGATPIEETPSTGDDDVLPEGFEAVPSTGSSTPDDAADDADAAGAAPATDAEAPPAP